MEKPDTSTPGIDYQESHVNEFISDGKERKHLENMKEAVEKDRAFYDSPENPGRDYNINDQAYSQTSPEDFVKTHSRFHHQDDIIENYDPE